MEGRKKERREGEKEGERVKRKYKSLDLNIIFSTDQGRS
jgi:hypothetical protein